MAHKQINTKLKFCYHKKHLSILFILLRKMIMQKLTLSCIFSTSIILGMQTPQTIVYKTDKEELKQQICDQRIISLLSLTHNGKKCDMLKIVNHSMDYPISIDCGNTPFTIEECEQKFTYFEEQAKKAQLSQLKK